MKSKNRPQVDYAVTLILGMDRHSNFNFNFICTVQMYLSYTYRIYNFLQKCTIQILQTENLERICTVAKRTEPFELATVMLEILNQKKPRFIFVKINGHIISTIYSKYYTKGLFTWRWGAPGR